MVTQSCSAIQVIKLRRQKSAGSFGFSLRGGCEHGTGFYVSDVEIRSEAEEKGLKVGDQILRVNGYTVDKAIHQEVLSVIKSRIRLVLKVKHAGMVPVKNHKKDPLTWRMVDQSVDFVPKIYNLHQEVVETEIFIDGANGPCGLGCSIAKGPDEKPGIFVQTTKIGGLANEAGLQTGDQILKMNNTTLEGVTFAEAVALLKSSPHMKLTVLKSVGLDLFLPTIRQNGNALSFPFTNDGLDNGKITRISTRLVHTQSDDTSSHNSSDHIPTSDDGSREVSSSIGTRSSFSDDQPSCSSSDDAGSLTSSETYGRTFLNGGWHETDSVSSISSVRKEQEKLAEERRKLEIDQLKLQQEAEQLSKEKEKLEQEKKKQLELNNEQLKPIVVLPPPEMKPFIMPQTGSSVNFLKELKEKSHAREQRSLDGSSSNSSSAGSPRGAVRPKGFLTDSENENIGEDCTNRRQHEKLMREFREAHQKMFLKTNKDSNSSDESKAEIENPKPSVDEIPNGSDIKESFTIENRDLAKNPIKSSLGHSNLNMKCPLNSSVENLLKTFNEVNLNEQRAVLRGKGPAPPMPPKIAEKEDVKKHKVVEKRVKILPEATEIGINSNMDEKILNRTSHKTCNGILKKPNNSQNKSKVNNNSSVNFSKIDIISAPDHHKSSEPKLEPKSNTQKAVVNSSNAATVRVTISSYPSTNIQKNRFAPVPAIKKNLTRVTINGVN